MRTRTGRASAIYAHSPVVYLYIPKAPAALIPSMCLLQSSGFLFRWLLILSQCCSFAFTFAVYRHSSSSSSLSTPTVAPPFRQTGIPGVRSRRPFFLSRLENLLGEYRYNSRIVTIHSKNLPVIAELFEKEEARLVLLEAFVNSEAGSPNGDITGSKARIRYIATNATRIISLGEITTIWEGYEVIDASALDKCAQYEQKLLRASPSKRLRIDRALDNLYYSRVGTSRSSSKGIHKKQVGQLAQECAVESNNSHRRDATEAILRHVIKAGAGFSRLVTSDTACVSLFSQAKGSERIESSAQRAIAASMLAKDSGRGGRFKRYPCMLVNANVDDIGVLSSITFINGGWIVTDQSVRAGAEAKQFVESIQAKDSRATVADERIVRRLECLALGELFSSDDSEIQVDVREALKAMDLPVSKKGATEALLRMGRWSGDEDLSRLEAWSTDILQAAAWYEEKRRQDSLLQALSEDRVDLTMYPCVCIDTTRTSFRDDAVGIRPRAATGRKVNADASQWELLVHIVDVSDINGAESASGPLACLRDAARSRVTSRYDLPQPLHLMPPRVLRALSFSSDFDCFRCVTLWAYIDERDGNIIDSGLERTVVRRPREFSYFEATSLMEKAPSNNESSDSDLRALLLVIERNLSRWSGRNLQLNESARRREVRMTSREQQPIESGREKFLRTRAHVLVDAGLDLYGSTLYGLLRKAGVAVPMAAGAGLSRGGRVATAPLRRFIDGETQRQALAALCNYGRVLSPEECQRVVNLSNEARKAIFNVRASKER